MNDKRYVNLCVASIFLIILVLMPFQASKWRSLYDRQIFTSFEYGEKVVGGIVLAIICLFLVLYFGITALHKGD